MSIKYTPDHEWIDVHGDGTATVGITVLNKIGHALENALLRRDNSDKPGSLEALGVIRQAIHEIDLILASLTDKRESPVPPGLIGALDELYPAQAIAQAGYAVRPIMQSEPIAYPSRIPRATSSCTSVINGTPVSRSVSRLAEAMSRRSMDVTANLRAPAKSCCNPAPSLSARVQMATAP